MNLKFNDLVNLVLNEAPMSAYINRFTSQEKRNEIARKYKEIQAQAQANNQQQSSQPSFTSRLGKAVKAAAPRVGRGAWEITKGVGGVAGEVVKNVGKAALNAPSAVKTARNFLIGDDPAGQLKQGIEYIKNKKKKGQEGETGVEDFDKDTIKAIINGQVSKLPTSGGQTTITPAVQGGTTSGTVQGRGQVTQGQVISGGLPGTSPPQTSTTATTASTPLAAQQQARLMSRDPKVGDVFTLQNEFGRITKYKIKKVDKDIVSAIKI
jgi:hypothetical protein